MHHLPPNPSGIRVLKSVESDILKASDSNLPTLAHCVTCKGRKVFRWYAEDGSGIVDYECPCREQFILYRYLQYNGLQRNQQRFGWREVLTDAPIVEEILQYGRDIEYNLDEGVGLYLYGSRGTGKSMLGSLLLKNALGQGYSGHFTSFIELRDMYSGGFKDQVKKDWYQSKIRNAEILVVDDPGREYTSSEKGVDFSRTIMDDLIRHRMAASLPTIITSNLTPDTFKQTYGENVASLITERMKPIVVTGSDFRPAKAALDDVLRTEHLVRPIVVA